MKQTLKIQYADFWPNFSPSKFSWTKELSKYYELVESDAPDFLIDGGLGCHHLKYDCVKILKQSENEVPNFNDFDYATGFDSLSFGDRYMRIPMFHTYAAYRTLFGRVLPSDEELTNRKFCSFVVSNSVGSPVRERFFSGFRNTRRWIRADAG